MTKRMQGGSVRAALAAGFLGTTVGLALLVAGCSGDNSGNPTGYGPEGVQGSAILLTDVQPFDADTTQVFVQMFVVSPPPPDGFRFYVNPNGEGFRAATGGAIPASTTFDSGWSFYVSSLDGYDPTTTSLELMARGARHGIESDASLVSSAAYIPAAPALALARRDSVTLTHPSNTDSATVRNIDDFAWAPLPGAQSYILQAFNASTGEPGLVVYVNDATKTRVGLETGMLNQVPYTWSVVAYDVVGRAIGVSRQQPVRYIPLH